MNKEELRAGITDALSDGDIARAGMGCVTLASALMDADATSEAEQALREGIAYIRIGADTHPTITSDLASVAEMLYRDLATLLLPSPEAWSLTSELVTMLSERHAHPIDLLEALALRAEIEIQAGTIDDAITATTQATAQAESICFHDVSFELERKMSDRLRRDGRTSEADEWTLRARARLDEFVPGHTHLWDIRMGSDGSWEPIPLNERHGGPDYSDLLDDL